MARTYKRDARGRFSGGGGGSSGGGGGRKKAAGGGGAKAPSTRAANNAVEKRMRSTGQLAIGNRLMKSTAEKFSGTAATKRSRAAAMGVDRRAGFGEEASLFSKAKPKGTMTRKAKGPKREIEPATLPGQKLQHYPRIPVNSAPAAGKKSSRKRGK